MIIVGLIEACNSTIENPETSEFLPGNLETFCLRQLNEYFMYYTGYYHALHWDEAGWICLDMAQWLRSHC